MLVYDTKLIGTPVLSVRAGSAVSAVSEIIVDPNQLKVIAFRLNGGVVGGGANLLDVSSIREYSSMGFVIDDVEELVTDDEVVRLSEVLELNFNLIGLKAESKSGSKLGKIMDYTVNPDDFLVQQLIVHRPTLKSFIDPELTIPRKEIAEVTDYKVIIKDEEKRIREKAAKEEFIPNFVNPFRNPESGFAPADTETPGDKGKQ